MERKREEERQQKLQEERNRRILEDKIRMEQERADFVEEDLDEVKTSVKPEINVKKLNISMEELERQRAERERERALLARKQRQVRPKSFLDFNTDCEKLIKLFIF